MHEATQPLQVLAQQVATALGAAWTAECPGDLEPHGYARVYRVDDVTCGVTMRPVWNTTGRLTFHGDYPHACGASGLRYGEARPEITVSASKTPEHIARDLTRRLLPIYLEQYQRCREAATQAKAADERQADTNTRARAMIRAYDDRVDGTPKRTQVWLKTASSNRTVTLELSHLCLDRLEAVLQWLSDHHA